MISMSLSRVNFVMRCSARDRQGKTDGAEMKDKIFVVATNNAHKLSEMQTLLKGLGYDCMSLKQAGISIEIIESGSTFMQNALIKARAVRQLCDMPVIADDSGLCVDALGGAPGIFTARYSKTGTSEANMEKLLCELDRTPDGKRTARFVSCIAAVMCDGSVITARGTLEGFIGREKLGENGFGYDPIFYLDRDLSLAQLTDEQKNAISHRGRALRHLALKLRGIKKMRSIK